MYSNKSIILLLIGSWITGSIQAQAHEVDVTSDNRSFSYDLQWGITDTHQLFIKIEDAETQDPNRQQMLAFFEQSLGIATRSEDALMPPITTTYRGVAYKTEDATLTLQLEKNIQLVFEDNRLQIFSALDESYALLQFFSQTAWFIEWIDNASLSLHSLPTDVMMRSDPHDDRSGQPTN
ncbi:MAG: hypothetical protein AAGB12_12815 [Pseudomonadota bacterium]